MRKVPTKTPTIINSTKESNIKTKSLKIKAEDLTFKKLATFDIPQMLLFITEIYKEIVKISNIKDGIYQDFIIVEIKILNQTYKIQLSELLFTSSDIEDFLDYLESEPDDYKLRRHLNRISINTASYTCGITEIGEIDTIPNNLILKQKFLTIALYIKSFYEIPQNHSGMVQITLVNKNHSGLITLIKEHLTPSTILNWINPRSDNALTTFIWV